MMDISARLARLEARIDIARLSSDYCFHCDTRQLDSLVDLFSPDAIVSIPAFKTEGAGRSGIAALYEAQLGSIDSSNHWTHDIAIDFSETGDASGRIMAHAEVVIAGTAFMATMHYDDHYCHVNGAWRFQARVINFLVYAPMAELAQRLASPFPIFTSGGWVAGHRSLQDPTRVKRPGGTA